MLDFRFPGPETAEFEAAYQAALMGQLVAKQTREADTQGSVAALITSYMRHADYIGLRESTKIGYGSRIEMLRTKHGHRSVARPGIAATVAASVAN